ncbi:MAG: NADH-quinone oxidoreductase subunit NuoN [Alphaproteobacteria bacterium]|nr:NADH-quinone oxidoreductase subunit NuoN [Alphaproteobacteria bacterium]
MTLLADLGALLPEIALVIGAVALLTYGVFQGEESRDDLVSILCVGLLLGAVALVASTGGAAAAAFDGAFRIDAFSQFSKAIIFGAAAFAILMSADASPTGALKRFEYPVLIVLASVGMSLMVSANDLIALYMSIETQSLALYVLAAFNRDSRRSTEAGLKYFVLGALSSGLLLYGASLVYGFAGSTSFPAIAAVATGPAASPGLVVGLVFVICGLAFKVSAAPFHMWTPDVYEGAPTPVTAFFAAAPKVAAMALFARALVGAFPEAVADWRPVIAMIAVASMAVGSVSAIVQTNIKRLLAYSSIGHMGFALVGLAAGTEDGVAGVLIYMSIYVVMTVGSFACVLMMRRQGGRTENISDLSGLATTDKGLALILGVLLFSLAGVPPTGGFFGKLFVFAAAVETGMIWLAVVGVLMSAIAAFYYLRIVKIIWFDDAAPAFLREGGARLGLIASLAAALMLPGLLFLIAPLQAAANTAAASLF